MRDLIQYAFDFFGYIIPGLFIIFSISILVLPIDSFQEVITLTKSFDNKLATVLVIVSYVIGFCIYPIGRLLYINIGFKLFGNSIDKDSNKSDLSVPEKYALLREHSELNFKYVESWNIYCAMSHNLMVACLIFSIVAIIKLIEGSPDSLIFWLCALVLSILLFFVLTYRAVTYYHWAAYDINAAISSLDLNKKSV